MGQEWPKPQRRPGSFNRPHQRKGGGKSSASARGPVGAIVFAVSVLALALVSVPVVVVVRAVVGG